MTPIKTLSRHALPMSQPPVTPEPARPQHAPAPKKRMNRALLALLIGVPVLVVVCIAGAVIVNRLGANSPEKDVTVTSCTADPLAMHAILSVVNSTNRTATYRIVVSFENASGNRLGQGVAHIPDLSAGQTANHDVIAFGNDGGALTNCRIADVTRF
jgi:hypothetical protein